MIKATQNDCVEFTACTIKLLVQKGFFVNSLQEALFCLSSIVDSTVNSDVQDSVKELHIKNAPVN